MKRKRSGKANAPKAQAASKPADSRMNPMLMFEVLSHLFTVMAFDFKDFQNFRLVSREWAKASLGRWREEVSLPLTSSPPTDDDQDDSDDDNPTDVQSRPSLHNFLELIKIPGDPYKLLSNTKHFRKFKISFSEDLCFGNPGQLEFWSKIGRDMTHLDISNSTVSSAEEFARILFEMTPNLRCLKFKSGQTQVFEVPYPFQDPDHEVTQIPIWDERVRPDERNVHKKLTEVHLNLCYHSFSLSWVYFLARVPNIKKLKVEALRDLLWTWGDETGASEQQIFLQSFQIVREKMGFQYFSQLEELDLLRLMTRAVDKLPPFLLPTLRDLNFPLKSLSLDIGYSKNCQRFKQLLEMYCNTLETLVVSRAPHSAPFPKVFPYEVDMPHLTELSFIGPIVKDLSFLRNVQNLRKLELSSNGAKTNPYLEVRPAVDVIGNTKFLSGTLKNVVLDQLEELAVESKTMICSGERVKALGKLFPNLKSLSIGLKDDGFAMVCKTWEKIETLNVGPNELTEKGILGKGGEQNYQKPNITDLKELKTLRMVAPLKNSSKGRLTTDSILHGLLLCPNLNEMSFAASPLVMARLASKCSLRYQ